MGGVGGTFFPPQSATAPGRYAWEAWLKAALMNMWRFDAVSSRKRHGELSHEPNCFGWMVEVKEILL